ncbi:unnamed protein product [Vicia faba]|uniref:Aminotransferase class I/classII domain-containing protein n=1 Tax=Vicia faba TaxID=3906 RepID=A0AAV0YD58_VICFA|nr:unnamed protein product [Vicia faba]
MQLYNNIPCCTHSLFRLLRFSNPFHTPSFPKPLISTVAMSTVSTETPPLQVSKRLERFKTTIFTQMSMLAIKHGAINLGQGFPNFDGPDFVKEAAIQAIRDGNNQYARGYGVPDSTLPLLREAIAATMLGLINPGDEVIVFAPFYDSYEATLSMAGAQSKRHYFEASRFCSPD